MKTLVTGATGFLGTALSQRLEMEGHDVVRLSSRNCDLTRSESLERLGAAPLDVIYHLAAWTQAGDFCLYHPGEQWVRNQQINTNVLAWWQRYQPQAKIVCIGTSCSYDTALPLREENYLVGTPIESLYTYAMTKRMLYIGLLSLQKQFGLKYLHVVPSTLYGPNYHTDGRQMHFIFDLIRKILAGKLEGTPVVLWGDGRQTRELVYLDDFVAILLKLAAGVDNETVNVGAGRDHTIREFAAFICDSVGYPFDRIQFDTTKYTGARSKTLVTEKLHRLLPDLRLTPLEEGLERTIQWFRKQSFSPAHRGSR